MKSKDAGFDCSGSKGPAFAVAAVGAETAFWTDHERRCATGVN